MPQRTQNHIEIGPCASHLREITSNAQFARLDHGNVIRSSNFAAALAVNAENGVFCPISRRISMRD